LEPIWVSEQRYSALYPVVTFTVINDQSHRMGPGVAGTHPVLFDSFASPRLAYIFPSIVCGGKVQGSAAQKQGGCLTCNFYKDVHRSGKVHSAADAIPFDDDFREFNT